MEDKGFISFSLESLGKMGLLSENEFRAYLGFYLARIESESDKRFEIFRYPCRINAYVGILCTEGSVEIISNLRHYIIKKNNLFISMPNDIIHTTGWHGCRLFIIAFDDNFVRKTNVNYSNALSILVDIQKHPCIKLPDEEADSLRETFYCMNRDIEAFKGKNYYDYIGMSYVNLIMYKGLSFISRYTPTQAEDMEGVNKRSEELFNKFMTLLPQYFRHQRGLEFYASKLYIAPKYMTSLIKKTSGKSAMEWINDCVIMEAKNLLRYSGMSIQEISEYLDFSNQSHFAQYFKRLTGVSPSEYREKE